ncbi:MAG: NCS2 family permease [Bacilli bacterium]
MNYVNKIFGYKEKGSSLITELLAGAITFVSMIYILPTNASILGAMGMDGQGVFVMTAIVSAIVTLMMGFVANFPIVLSAGMGLNAYITFSVSLGMGFSWQESMILLLVSGIIFFIFSLTPVRTKIINKIPTDIKYIISAGLGAFICFVGLRGSGIISFNIGNPSNVLPELGSLSNPAILIPFLGIILIIFLMLCKNKWLSKLAIPIGVIVCAIASVSINYGLNGSDALKLANSGLSMFSGSWGAANLEKVVFFGFLDPNNTSNIGEMLAKIFSNPASYIAIFSLIFVNLFDTTATLLAVGKDSGLLDENGQLKNAKRAILCDATGALICAPLGTSTVTSFAESNVGVSVGGRTGLTAVFAGILFLISAFAFPVFSIFSSWSVTAPALVCVGGLIFANNLKSIKWESFTIGITAFFTIIFMVLTYSISTGLGVGIILYVLMNLASGKKEDNNAVLYTIAGIFVLSFILTEVVKLI